MYIFVSWDPTARYDPLGLYSATSIHSWESSNSHKTGASKLFTSLIVIDPSLAQTAN